MTLVEIAFVAIAAFAVGIFIAWIFFLKFIDKWIGQIGK